MDPCSEGQRRRGHLDLCGVLLRIGKGRFGPIERSIVLTHQPDAGQIQQVAEEVFEVWTLSWIGPENEDKYDLNEAEALTLDLLTKNEQKTTISLNTTNLGSGWQLSLSVLSPSRERSLFYWASQRRPSLGQPPLYI